MIKKSSSYTKEYATNSRQLQLTDWTDDANNNHVIGETDEWTAEPNTCNTVFTKYWCETDGTL